MGEPLDVPKAVVVVQLGGEHESAAGAEVNARMCLKTAAEGGEIVADGLASLVALIATPAINASVWRTQMPATATSWTAASNSAEQPSVTVAETRPAGIGPRPGCSRGQPRPTNPLRRSVLRVGGGGVQRHLQRQLPARRVHHDRVRAHLALLESGAVATQRDASRRAVLRQHIVKQERLKAGRADLGHCGQHVHTANPHPAHRLHPNRLPPPPTPHTRKRTSAARMKKLRLGAFKSIPKRQ